MHRLGWRRVRLPALAKSGQRPWAYKKPWVGGGASALQVVQKVEEPCLIKRIDTLLKLWAEDLHSESPEGTGSGNMTPC